MSFDAKSYARNYYFEHRDTIIQRTCKWYADHPEGRRNHNRNYYASHSEKCKNRTAKWREENRERYNAYMRDYRAKRRMMQKGIQL